MALMTSQYVKLLLLLIVLAGVVRIVTAYPHVGQTWDEPSHTACGMEWLDQGTYDREPAHPPLVRAMLAAGPYIAGARAQGKADYVQEGNAIFHSIDYPLSLYLARAGNLPFFILAVVFVYLFAANRLGPPAGLASALVFSFTPSVLALSGLAINDMGLVGTYAMVIWAADRWIEDRSTGRSLIFALACGLCVLAKYTAVIFIPLFLLPLYASRRLASVGVPLFSWGMAKSVALMSLAGLVILWAGFQFSLKSFPLDNPKIKAEIERNVNRFGPYAPAIMDVLSKPVWPLSEVVLGIGQASVYNRTGRQAYLRGEQYVGGRWDYFPTAMFLKTPTAMTCLTLLGAVLLGVRVWRQGDWRNADILVTPTLIMAFVMTGNINIGSRHALPVYLFASIMCGYAVAHALERSKPTLKAVTLALLVWYAGVSLAAHPHYLTFFNFVADDQPEAYLLGSDLDWGQDIWALSDRLQELGIEEVGLSYNGSMDLSRAGLPRVIQDFGPAQPPEWVAVSVANLKYKQDLHWLASVAPAERIGDSIFLYHFPNAQ
jgi:4-amino-4-deoxy-L-arabinose transferase-like glycosyltransferase